MTIRDPGAERFPPEPDPARLRIHFMKFGGAAALLWAEGFAETPHEAAGILFDALLEGIQPEDCLAAIRDAAKAKASGAPQN